jgi:hypothetical protein
LASETPPAELRSPPISQFPDMEMGSCVVKPPWLAVPLVQLMVWPAYTSGT